MSLCIFPPTRRRSVRSRTRFRLLYDVRAFMPPQGLLLIAAYLPETWEVRFIDENMGRPAGDDFAWADVVMVSGMHVQAPQIRDIHRRAAAAGKVMVLGGPSVSAAPEMYPDIDYLHIGEIGDATDALIALLDRDVTPPRAQVRFETNDRLAAHRFSDSGLRRSRARPLPDRQPAVFQRLSLSLRILRYPGALWASAAAEDRPNRCLPNSMQCWRSRRDR